jgi:hypothetical protein
MLAHEALLPEKYRDAETLKSLANFKIKDWITIKEAEKSLYEFKLHYSD